jgi:exonuclease SbcD
MKIAHVADQHLGSSRGLVEDGLNLRLMDHYRCGRFVVEDGIARGAELILSAGDLFDTPRPSPTEINLARQMFEPAQAAGVPVILALGNHEAPRNPAECHALDTLRGVPGVTIADRPCILEAWRHGSRLRLTEPATAEERAAGDTTELQIAVMPWPNVSLLLADAEIRRLEPGARNIIVRQAVMDILRGLAGQLVPGVPSVLLAHAPLDVATIGDKLMLESNEWTLSAAEVAALGFDAVLLGHIHGAQECAPNVWYSGSPEACTHNDEGQDKSYGLLSLGTGPSVAFRHLTYDQIETPFRHFVTLERADLNEDGSPVVPGMVADAIVRVRIPEESTLAHDSTLRTQIEAAGAVEVTVDIQRAEAERRAGAQEIAQEQSLDGQIDKWVDQRPDLDPLRGDLKAAAADVDATAKGGAA